MEATQAILGDMTINETIREWPETVGIFQLFGLDACCGGPLPIREAAERHGLEPDTVLMALNRHRGS
jgi:regulator of cell morphogenesis and NO signaling